MEETVVLYPCRGVGHIVPAVELGKLFLRRGFSVVIPVIDTSFDSAVPAAALDRIASANSSINFHHLPFVPPPPNPPANSTVLLFDVLRRITPHLRSFLDSLSRTCHLRALVLDFFCTDALDVAVQLGIPAYFFFPTSASNLAAFVRLPTLQRSAASLRDLGESLVEFPGLQPIPASYLPSIILETEEAFSEFLCHFERLPRADGIIVNTFKSLEARAVKAISDGLCLPDRPMPPIYCIGPLISNENSHSKHECIEWLNSQPLRSVVFLCFGSLGSFSAKQLKEISVGLERSGHRFLWVVRSPPSDDPNKRFAPPPKPDLDALLPEGFMERTKERGLVVKSWAPQAAVLTHEAVGGFVTHCGWNSVLEAVSAGVAMIAWPLYAEQRMNKAFLVEEVKLAVEMRGYEEELVRAEEVEARVSWLMDSDGGRELRERAIAAKDGAAAALGKGGSSHTAFLELVKPLFFD